MSKQDPADVDLEIQQIRIRFFLFHVSADPQFLAGALAHAERLEAQGRLPASAAKMIATLRKAAAEQAAKGANPG